MCTCRRHILVPALPNSQQDEMSVWNHRTNESKTNHGQISFPTKVHWMDFYRCGDVFPGLYFLLAQSQMVGKRKERCWMNVVPKNLEIVRSVNFTERGSSQAHFRLFGQYATTTVRIFYLFLLLTFLNTAASQCVPTIHKCAHQKGRTESSSDQLSWWCT